MSKHQPETYWAIRIGDPRYHLPYFWVGEDGRIPVLFFSKKEAQEALAEGFNDISAKVVRVKIKAS